MSGRTLHLRQESFETIHRNHTRSKADNPSQVSPKRSALIFAAILRVEDAVDYCLAGIALAILRKGIICAGITARPVAVIGD